MQRSSQAGEEGLLRWWAGPQSPLPTPRTDITHQHTPYANTPPTNAQATHTACLRQFLSQHALRVLWAPLLPEALPVPWGGQEAPGSQQGLGECNGPCLDAPPSQGSPPSSPSPWLRAGGSQQQPLVRLGGE